MIGPLRFVNRVVGVARREMERAITLHTRRPIEKLSLGDVCVLDSFCWK